MKNPHFIDEELAKIAAELEKRPAHVYANRDKGFTWEGAPMQVEVEPSLDFDVTGEGPPADSVADMTSVVLPSVADTGKG
jgi:hypothetical protein